MIWILKDLYRQKSSNMLIGKLNSQYASQKWKTNEQEKLLEDDKIFGRETLRNEFKSMRYYINALMHPNVIVAYRWKLLHIPSAVSSKDLGEVMGYQRNFYTIMRKWVYSNEARPKRTQGRSFIGSHSCVRGRICVHQLHTTTIYILAVTFYVHIYQKKTIYKNTNKYMHLRE